MKDNNFRRNIMDYNRDDVTGTIMSKEAYPEMRFKLSIFEAEERLVSAEYELMRSRSLNNNLLNPILLTEFRCCIVSLWRHIKCMAADKGCINMYPKAPGSPSDFDLLSRLERGDQSFELFTLIHLENYVMFVLHSLKLTNLLIENNLDFENKLVRDF